MFIEADPFDHLFSVLINPEYLPAMRKKKGVDHAGEGGGGVSEVVWVMRCG